MVQDPPVVVAPVSVPVVKPSVSSVNTISPVKVSSDEVAEVQDTEEYVEENLSLDEVEKEMIRKALERHHGKRKNAANDLKISERTLYRKIKEYGLD
jgi:DNA-binding NtrC family response regulator